MSNESGRKLPLSFQPLPFLPLKTDFSGTFHFFILPDCLLSILLLNLRIFTETSLRCFNSHPIFDVRFSDNGVQFVFLL